MTPTEAKKPSNEADAKMAMELVARRGAIIHNFTNRRYSENPEKKKVARDKEWMDQ